MGCTLRDITNRLYSKKVECVDDEGQEYFYQAQFKNFKDICETLDIADEIKWIKKRGYCFDDRDMGFWCYILENYSDTEMVCSSSKNVSKRAPKRLAPCST